MEPLDVARKPQRVTNKACPSLYDAGRRRQEAASTNHPDPGGAQAGRGRRTAAGRGEAETKEAVDWGRHTAGTEARGHDSNETIVT